MPDPVTDPEEVLPVKIKDTLEYLIWHDKAEINKLLKKFLDNDEKDDVVRLCELVETWIAKQVATEKEIQFGDIKHMLVKVRKFPSILRSKLFRLEMLLKDIFKNRYCVTNFVQRMDNVLSHSNVSTKDVSDTLKNLVRDGLISDKQYNSLSKEDNLNLEKVISEIKTTKIGRGMNFLP